MDEHREIELKLDLAREDVETLRRASRLASAPSSKQHLQSIYFDTPGGKLRKAGFTLRVRREGETFLQTIKSTGGGAGLFDRDEWNVPVDGLELDLDAALSTPLESVLTPTTRAKLQARATIDVDRTSWSVQCGEAVVDVTLDEGVISAGDSSEDISELELELKHGSRKALFRLCDQMLDAAPLRLGVLSKADRALAVEAGTSARINKSGKIDLDKEATVADAFKTILLSCIQHFRLNEAILVEQRNPEALHQTRVAMRRLRSVFELFSPIFHEGRRYRRLSKDLRWCSRILGKTRNLDVFLMLTRRHSLDLPQIERVREEGYDRVTAMLRSRRFLAMMLRLVRWSHVGKWRNRASAARPIGAFALRRLTKAWSKIGDGHALLAQMTEEQRHRFRVRTKQFRYMLEFLRSITPDPGQRRKAFQACLEGLQDDLGALNDMVLVEQLAGNSGISARPLLDQRRRKALLTRAEKRQAELVAIGPYWLVDNPPKRPEAAAVRPQASTSRPAASRRRAPRSDECVPD